MSRIDEQMVNSIRVLSMDMIEKANSDIPVYRWEPHQWLSHFGKII